MRKLRIEDLDLFVQSGTPCRGEVSVNNRQRFIDIVDMPRRGRHRPSDIPSDVQSNTLDRSDRRPEEGQQQQTVVRSNVVGLG